MGATHPDDLQNVKLFLGQIPCHMWEDGLRELFGPYGDITGVKILTDKVTGMHKGCAFLTYRTKEMCDAAIEGIHNKKIFPPAKNPIQVKYADGELERFENKLFVGQIPKDKTDQDIHNLFSQYGDIEKINLLRDTSGASKGCCFVKFRSRQAAEAAIAALSDYRFDTSTNLPSGLVVKFADTEQQRTQRKMAKIATQYAMSPQYYGVPGVYAAPYAYYPPGAYAQAMPASLNAPYGAYPAYAVASPQQLQEGPPGANLFIPATYTEAELQAAFVPYGNVMNSQDASTMTNRNQRRTQ